MQTSIIIDPHSISEDEYTDTTWLRYFDIKQALQGLHAHIGNLPSDKTDERHTRSKYIHGIKYFIKWAGGASMKLPTEQLITEYIAHLLHEKEWTRAGKPQFGVSAGTVSGAYLAPLRIFLKKLSAQIVKVHGYEREFVYDCKSHIENAAKVENPSIDTKTNIAPLWNPKFTRLNVEQVQSVLRAIDKNTITGARDYALLRLMFESALRIAEAQRITLNTIKPEDEHYIITVRGKRNNIDPVAISTDCYADIRHYIETYNAPLAEDDPRRITDDTPLFQALRKGDTHWNINDGVYDPARGLSLTAMRRIIKSRTGDELGKYLACTPHDCRRTFAFIAHDAGMNIRDISKALRHADVSITWRYIGTQPDNSKTLLSKYVNLAV